MRDPDIQVEVSNLLKFCVKDPETKEQLSMLFVRALGDERLVKNFKLMLEDTLNDFCRAQKSVDSMRTFLYNFTNTHEQAELGDKTLLE